MTLKDSVKFPPARDFAIAKLEIKGILRRFPNMATSFVHKTRADCKTNMRFQDSFMQSASDTRNKLGNVVNEQIRLVAFDLIAELEDAKEGGDLDPKFITEVIFKVSRGLKELEQAEKLNAEREDEIKALVVKETAEKVETACRKKGVTQEAKEAILAEIFSITEKS